VLTDSTTTMAVLTEAISEVTTARLVPKVAG
jgi:hypothetical protein